MMKKGVPDCRSGGGGSGHVLVTQYYILLNDPILRGQKAERDFSHFHFEILSST